MIIQALYDGRHDLQVDFQGCQESVDYCSDKRIIKHACFGYSYYIYSNCIYEYIVSKDVESYENSARFYSLVRSKFSPDIDVFFIFYTRWRCISIVYSRDVGFIEGVAGNIVTGAWYGIKLFCWSALGLHKETMVSFTYSSAPHTFKYSEM